ncbi:protein translocase SEC61 complex subunit gamma [Candidatus Woesearchaeota archaeon]|nr:protein translocase SEC61 complex subunit gamma [Candidatus Woesearchaeota archaeon]MCF7901593.1 protein translocase SEC61 complex subunit gamma [Candidatus Woesearchaeota archaeon]MCF8013642.1 protein translocase SEC61 complex subunit gamma [Candidatus Woesearchaeota archaeon]
MGKIGNFIQESIRVFRITKKPTKEEYKSIALVSALGILLIGLIGALISILSNPQIIGLGLTVIIAFVIIIILMFYKKKN